MIADECRERYEVLILDGIEHRIYSSCEIDSSRSRSAREVIRDGTGLRLLAAAGQKEYERTNRYQEKEFFHDRKGKDKTVLLYILSEVFQENDGAVVHRSDKTVLRYEILLYDPVEHEHHPSSLFEHERIIYLVHDIVSVERSEMFLVPFVDGFLAGIDIVDVSIDQSREHGAELRPVDVFIRIEDFVRSLSIRLESHDIELAGSLDIEFHLIAEVGDVRISIAVRFVGVRIETDDLDSEQGHHLRCFHPDERILQSRIRDRAFVRYIEAVCPLECIVELLIIVRRIRDVAARRSMCSRSAARSIVISCRVVDSCSVNSIVVRTC